MLAVEMYELVFLSIKVFIAAAAAVRVPAHDDEFVAKMEGSAARFYAARLLRLQPPVRTVYRIIRYLSRTTRKVLAVIKDMSPEPVSRSFPKVLKSGNGGFCLPRPGRPSLGFRAASHACPRQVYLNSSEYKDAIKASYQIWGSEVSRQPL